MMLLKGVKVLKRSVVRNLLTYFTSTFLKYNLRTFPLLFVFPKYLFIYHHCQSQIVSNSGVSLLSLYSEFLTSIVS